MARSRTDRIRVPKNLTGELTGLIYRTAKSLRGDGKDADYRRSGLANAQIVTAALSQAIELVGEHIDALVAEFLAGLIPKVLGDGVVGETIIDDPMIPGLILPLWMPCLPENDGAAGWKRERDMTPDELDRLIEHRAKIIQGHQVERRKLIILRDEALNRGCDPDAPVSSVFVDIRVPSPPEDRPTA